MTLSAIDGYDIHNYSGLISNDGVNANNTLKFTLLADTVYEAKIILRNFELIKTFSKQ